MSLCLLLSLDAFSASSLFAPADALPVERLMTRKACRGQSRGPSCLGLRKINKDLVAAIMHGRSPEIQPAFSSEQCWVAGSWPVIVSGKLRMALPV